MILNLSNDGKQLLYDYNDPKSYFYRNFSEVNFIKKFYASPDDYPMLYHYTSIDALDGITQSKKFIINPAREMNDDKEIIYTKQLALDIFKKYSNREDEIYDFKNSLNAPFKGIYLMSFTDNDHSQALSNGYGNLAIGMKNQDIQIAFSKAGAHGKQKFNDFDENNFYAFPLKVNYDKKFQEKMIKNLVKSWIIAYRNLNVYYDAMDEILMLLKKDIFLLSLLFKRSVLYQEEEIRYVIISKKQDVDIDFSRPININFDEKLIKSVIYGHDLKENKKQINDILEKNGFNNVDVKLTKLPY